MRMAVNIAAPRIWAPFKELDNVVKAAVTRQQPDAVQDLEMLIRKHKQDFINLLKNAPPNKAQRDELKKADVNGLAVQGKPTPQLLDKQFIEECIIISDLFELNEYSAVELLSAAEQQLSYHPNLTRGLVAVLLYYDGRACLMSSLATLIKARQGRSWTLDCPEEVTSTATKFVHQRLADGLVNTLLERLNECNLQKEMDKLQAQKAIGYPKHRQALKTKISEIESSLAECVYSLAVQAPLNKEDTLQLLAHLRKLEPTPDGILDKVTMALFMALIYSLDVHILEEEDFEEVLPKLPILSDPTYLPHIHREIQSASVWANPGMGSAVQFAWGLTLRALSQCSSLQGKIEECEEDELVVTDAIENGEGVFQFLRLSVIANDGFHQDEFYYREIHRLITDFIVQMPLKVKELRNSGEDSARTRMSYANEGLEPPEGLRDDFEQLMLLISDIYKKDPLNMELALEFWCPTESTVPNAGGMGNTTSNRPPQKQISLFKFVTLAGDILPASMYISYIEMLSGLANGKNCAYHAFNLLKNNATIGGQVNHVSWDHFFQSLSQYYASLRQEIPAQSDMAQAYRHHARNITPQEVEGLSAVLRLIRVVAEKSEIARGRLWETPSWAAIASLLGLISCNVPCCLKGELLRTLAALGKSPDYARYLWDALESSQILPTVTEAGVHPTGGIQVELDEVEARNEEFPMTLAFVELLSTLCDSLIPVALGVGYRAPGFDPYLEFLRDSVFLKFNTRAYKDLGEKWSVSASVLDMFHKLLKNYEMSQGDFHDQTVEMQGGGTAIVNKPPGYILMVHMLNESPMLKLILYIIDEVTKQLEKYSPIKGKEEMERTALVCLRMIAVTLEQQELFLKALREEGCRQLASPMDRLLMGINPRSGKADHLVNIAKFVTFADFLPEHALAAVRILGFVCQSTLVQPELVGLFTSNETISKQLLHGFVECVETDEPEDPEKEYQEEEELTMAYVRNETRHCIMRLLLRSIESPAPNLAHFLLGFELHKPISKTNLQDPGIHGSPRTCLHGVLTILERKSSTGGGLAFMTDTPRTAELAYHLIYVLCANRDTSSPTMRYLRTAHDFLYRHIQYVPFQLPEGESLDYDTLLIQQSWLLKALAIELRLTSVNRQRSHVQRMLNLLLEDSMVMQNKVLRPDGTYEQEYGQYDLDMTSFGATQYTLQQSLGGSQVRRKVLSILDSINFCQQQPGIPDVEVLNLSDLENICKICEVHSEQGVVLIDARKLHSILTNEVNRMQSSAIGGQRDQFLRDIQIICEHVVALNKVKESTHIRKQAFESWRQVIEIILMACPEDLLQGETRQNVLFELLSDLLVKVSEDNVAPELAVPVSGVILTLMCNLRQCFLSDQAEVEQMSNLSQYVTLLDGLNSTSSKPDSKGQTGARTLYASSLQLVLKSLIEHIIRSSTGSQRVRANLYGALLYYLQIAQKPKGVQIMESGGVEQRGVGSLIASKDSEYDRLVAENMETILNYGENFMDVVCRDACDGHDVGRMLALAVLDAIVMSDRHQQWLSHMISKGYIQHIVESLRNDDQQLQTMLSPQPAPLKALYIFESKLGLLTRVAETVSGAQGLLQCGIMARLAECEVFDRRPEIDRNVEQSGFIPTIMMRYRQLLFPVLKLCLAVLTTLGIENREAGQQVMVFVVSHGEVIHTILKDRNSSMTLQGLQELALTTAVISRAAVEDGEHDSILTESLGIEFRGNISRIQRQMLALLPRFSLSEKMMKQIKNLGTEENDSGDTQAQIQVAVEEIASNVVAYCRAVVSKSATSAQFSRILFNPSLMEATSRDFSNSNAGQSGTSTMNSSPNLGIIVHMLNQSTRLFMNVFDVYKQNRRKLSSLSELSSEELKELSGTGGQEKMSAQQRQNLAKTRLYQLVSYKGQELQLLSYIIENCLFILWRHLDYYLVHCVPSDQSTSLYQLQAQKQHQMRRLQDYPIGSPSGDFESPSSALIPKSGISRAELDQLKSDAVSCINETLFKKLQEIEQYFTKSRTRYGFMEALIRRVKRLLRLHTG